MTPNTGNSKAIKWSGNKYTINGPGGQNWLNIVFQENSVKTVGYNGICMLDILDAMIDRLLQFERKWPCQENQGAIEAMREAKGWLKNKRDRRSLEAVR